MVDGMWVVRTSVCVESGEQKSGEQKRNASDVRLQKAQPNGRSAYVSLANFQMQCPMLGLPLLSLKGGWGGWGGWGWGETDGLSATFYPLAMHSLLATWALLQVITVRSIESAFGTSVAIGAVIIAELIRWSFSHFRCHSSAACSAASVCG